MKKKFVCVLLSVLIVFALFPSGAFAAGASVSGNSTLRAGDTLTVTFSLSGYSKVYGIEGTINYDSSLLTFKSASGLMPSGWSVEYNNKGGGAIKFVAYDNNNSNPVSGGNVIRLKFTVSSSAKTGASVQVSSSGVVLSTGSATDPTSTSVSNASYSKKIAAPLSTNNYLSSLSVSGYSLSPSFSKTQLGYRVSVPYTLKSLPIQAKAADSSAKVSITGNSLTPGKTVTVNVNVTSASGAKRTYKIVATVAKDPNAKQSTANDLKSLTVSPGILSPVFDSAVTSYVVYVPYEVTNVKVSASPKDTKGEVKVENVQELVAGEDNLIRVISTAEDGGEKVYTITVKRALAWGDVSTQSADATEILAQIASAGKDSDTIYWDLSASAQTQIDRTVFDELRNNSNAALLIDFGSYKVEVHSSADMAVTEEYYQYALSNDESTLQSIRGYLGDASFDTLLFSSDAALTNFQKFYTMTSYLEGETLNVYRFDTVESKFYLVAEGVEVAAGGMISFYANKLGGFVFTPASIEGAVREDVSIAQNASAEGPFTLDSLKNVFSSMDTSGKIVLGGCAFVALLFGLGIGFLAFGRGKARLRKRVYALEHSATAGMGAPEMTADAEQASLQKPGGEGGSSAGEFAEVFMDDEPVSPKELKKLEKQKAKEARIQQKEAAKAQKLEEKALRKQEKLRKKNKMDTLDSETMQQQEDELDSYLDERDSLQ